MALSKAQVAAEVEKLGYKVEDCSNYKSLATPIKIRCAKGHLIEVSLGDLRRPSFTCPCCDTSISFINPKTIPEKKGYRIIAFDQATEHFGLSIWDDGELKFYNLFTFSGDAVNRLIKIKKFVSEIVIDAWKPDYIVMEDIQQQHGAVLTYKILAMLLGILEVTCAEKGIQYEVVSPNVWRKFAGTCGKTRHEEKMLSVATVKQKYGVTVTDDIAEAILIGQYGSRVHKKEYPLAFGI